MFNNTLIYQCRHIHTFNNTLIRAVEICYSNKTCPLASLAIVVWDVRLVCTITIHRTLSTETMKQAEGMVPFITTLCALRNPLTDAQISHREEHIYVHYDDSSYMKIIL